MNTRRNTHGELSLLKQIQNGDEEALMTLHQRYADLVYSVAYHILQNQQDAEEVTQDAFMRLWHKSAHYDDGLGTFKTWFLTMTRHIAIDKYRKRQRRTPNTGMFSMDEHPRLWETELISADNPELEGTIRQILTELSTEQREAIQLAYFHGMSHTEIAEHLNRPLGTVKSHLRQAMQKLRHAWFDQKK